MPGLGWDNSSKSVLRYWVLLLANSWRRNRSSPSSVLVARGTQSRRRFVRTPVSYQGAVSLTTLPLLRSLSPSGWRDQRSSGETIHTTQDWEECEFEKKAAWWLVNTIRIKTKHHSYALNKYTFPIVGFKVNKGGEREQNIKRSFGMKEGRCSWQRRYPEVWRNTYNNII